jgi:hypothetical protein
VQHTQQLPQAFPWRTATVVVGVVAAVELVALIGIGATRLAGPVRAHAIAAAKHTTASPARHAAPPTATRIAAPPAHPLRPRARVSVLVLNGNGVNGAAGSEATRLMTLGYAPSRSEDAPRHDYARSMVMYLPGYVREARRLGRDAGIRMVSVLDGMPRAHLKGSQLVVVLGGS